MQPVSEAASLPLIHSAARPRGAHLSFSFRSDRE